MNQLLPMRATLVELEKAIDAKDVLRIGQCCGRLCGPLANLYLEPRPTDPAKQKQWDSLAGPCLLLIHRCHEKITSTSFAVGLRGVPYNPATATTILDAMEKLIDPTGELSAATGGPADSPTPLETPAPPTPTDDSPKPG